VFGTAERAVRAATRPMAGFLERGSGTGWTSTREQTLEQEVIRLRARLSGERLSRRDHAQLARLPRLYGPGRSRIIAASVIAVGQGYQQAVTLDVGTHNGVAAQETVLNAAGVVGTVTSAGPSTCTVLLATDPTSVVGVRLAATGKIGWVTGTAKSLPGSDLLTLHVLGANNAIRPGQRLVTSASVGNRPYVAGVPVGVVTRVVPGAGVSGTAMVRPSADFAALDVVGVITKPGPPLRGAGG